MITEEEVHTWINKGLVHQRVGRVLILRIQAEADQRASVIACGILTAIVVAICFAAYKGLT